MPLGTCYIQQGFPRKNGAGATFRAAGGSFGMNNNALAALSFVAVLAATVFFPIAPATSSFALTLTGVLAMLASDYGRELRPVRIRAEVIPVDFSGRGATQSNQAA
jgi:hypothetical protein